MMNIVSLHPSIIHHFPPALTFSASCHCSPAKGSSRSTRPGRFTSSTPIATHRRSAAVSLLFPGTASPDPDRLRKPTAPDRWDWARFNRDRDAGGSFSAAVIEKLSSSKRVSTKQYHHHTISTYFQTKA